MLHQDKIVKHFAGPRKVILANNILYILIGDFLIAHEYQTDMNDKFGFLSYICIFIFAKENFCEPTTEYQERPSYAMWSNSIVVCVEACKHSKNIHVYIYVTKSYIT